MSWSRGRASTPCQAAALSRTMPATAPGSRVEASNPHSGHGRSSTQVQSLASGTIGMAGKLRLRRPTGPPISGGTGVRVDSGCRSGCQATRIRTQSSLRRPTPGAGGSCRPRTSGRSTTSSSTKLDHTPAREAELGGALGAVLALATSGVRAVPVELDDQALLVPEQIDTCDPAPGPVGAPPERPPAAGHRQAGLGDDPDRLLLEPAVAQRTPVGAVEQRGEERQARPTTATEGVEAPAEVGPPDLPAPLRVVEHRLEPGRREERGEVADRARRVVFGIGDPKSQSAAMTAPWAVDPTGNRPRLPVAWHRDLGLVGRQDAVEPGECAGGGVRGDGECAGRQHRGEPRLAARDGMGGVDAAPGSADRPQT